MDSEERHELQQNDLAEFFKNFGDFWNRHGTWIMAVFAISALSFAGYNILTNRHQTAQEQAWLDLAGTASPEGFEEVASRQENAAVKTIANLRGADLLVTQVATGVEAEKAATPDDDTADGEDNAISEFVATPMTDEEKLTLAKKMYQAALDSAPHLIYKLNALEGLGVVAESTGDLADARTRYQAIKTQAGEAYPAWITRADQRLAMLDTLAEPVRFAPEPEPVPEAAEPEATATEEPGEAPAAEAPAETPAADPAE